MKPLRTDTTAPHPLFEGMPLTYAQDQEWRKDIPKARADDE